MLRHRWVGDSNGRISLNVYCGAIERCARLVRTESIKRTAMAQPQADMMRLREWNMSSYGCSEGFLRRSALTILLTRHFIYLWYFCYIYSCSGSFCVFSVLLLLWSPCAMHIDEFFEHRKEEKKKALWAIKVHLYITASEQAPRIAINELVKGVTFRKCFP